MKKKVKVGVGVWDLHHDQHNKKLWENILKVIKELKPDFFVLGGDNMNMTSVSHWLHDKGDKRHLEGKRLRQEYDTFQKDILDRLKKVLPKKCLKIWLDGNHEGWLEKYIDRIPELEGFAEIEKCLDLKDWKVYKYHQVAKVGKLYFTHGDYTTKYTAAKTLDVFGRNIFVGHGHSYQVHTKITPIDCEAHTCIEMPCACDMNPDYMKDKPSAWVNGFGVFYIQPNGNFNAYPVISSKSSFVFNGKLYE